MRITVLGAGGQLGMELLQVLPNYGHEVFGFKKTECDVKNLAAIKETIAKCGPEIVINCAAWTKVDAAESHATEARQINALGALNVAKACEEDDIKLCHISTDFIFEGKSNTPIDESVKPNPLSVYGATKLEGEQLVAQTCRQHQIVRTSWLYGQAGPNFVLTMVRLAKEKGMLAVVSDQYGSPTWTGDLALALEKLIQKDDLGIFHLSNSGMTTWYGFAKAIMQQLNWSIPIKELTTAEFPTPAKRPAYSMLDNRRWLNLGEQPLPSWEKGLKAYLTQVTHGV